MSSRLNVVATALLTAAVIVPAGDAFAQTKLLRFPDIHGDRVVFCYAGDLWTAPATGGTATRLTAHPGLELFPKFSPDGKWIAFTGQYDGDEQVYVIPADGRRAAAAHLLPGARAPRAALGLRQPGLSAGRPTAASIALPLAARRRRHPLRERSSTRCRRRAARRRRCRCRPPARATSRPTASASSTRRCSATSAPGSATRAAGRRTSTSSTSRRNDAETDHRPRRAPSATRCGSATRSTSSPTATGRSTSTPTTSRAKAVTQLTSSTTWDVRWPSADHAAAHRLRAGRRAARLRRRSRQGRPAALDHRARRRRRDAPVARTPAEQEHRGLRAQPQGRARAVRGPRRRLHRADREGPDAQPDELLERPRQVGALVAGRQADRLHLRPQRRGRGLARSTRTAAASPSRSPPAARRMRYAPEWSPDGKRSRLLRQGRQALRRDRSPTRSSPRSPTTPRGTDPRLRLVAERALTSPSRMSDASGTRSLHIWSAADGQLHRVTDDVFNEYGPAGDPTASTSTT